MEGFDMHRLKGLLHFIDGTKQIVQGVQQMFEITESRSGNVASVGDCKIVLIGRGLGHDPKPWLDSFLEHVNAN